MKGSCLDKATWFAFQDKAVSCVVPGMLCGEVRPWSCMRSWEAESVQAHSVEDIQGLVRRTKSPGKPETAG